VSVAIRANRPPTGGALAEPGRARDDLPVARDRPRRSNANLEAVPIESAERREPAGGGPHAGADRATLAALEAALVDARPAADDTPALVVLASRLGDLGTPPIRPPAGRLSLRQARDDWLGRLEASQKSESALVAYRVAIDDLLDWAEANGRSVLEEATIVDYLPSYQQRARTAQATSTGASSSCASSFGGSANGKASATHSPTSTRRRSRGRSVTGWPPKTSDSYSTPRVGPSGTRPA
jgi:hypothetical protein